MKLTKLLKKSKIEAIDRKVLIGLIWSEHGHNFHHTRRDVRKDLQKVAIDKTFFL
jgi:hypothetical protein